MPLTHSDRDEIRSDSNFIGGQAVKWTILVVALFLLLGAAIWGITTMTSGVKGQGDAQRQKNSAENWTKAQADFQRRYNSILSLDRQITVAYAAKEKDPDDQVKEINYTGLVNNCIGAVGEYNSKAQEYLAGDFRDADLPERIDDTDPKTDCKEG